MPPFPHPIFRAASDQALLVSLGSEISPPVHHRVVQLLRAIEPAKIPGILNLHPAYCSLLIRFDPLVVDHTVLEVAVRGLLESACSSEPPQAKTVEIPVRYGGEFGPDLDEVASLCRLTPDAVAELHASTLYTVYFLGFVPGFAYLGDLPKPLVVPRLPTPRTRVPSGSVAIASDQTGVYPVSAPGGWRLIGRTPLELFNPKRENMSLLDIGDRVKFRPIR